MKQSQNAHRKLRLEKTCTRDDALSMSLGFGLVQYIPKKAKTFVQNIEEGSHEKCGQQ
jgi:hypothetical protein